MKFVCEKDMCTGCMACVDICAKKAIKISDSLKSYNAIIDENLCVKCGSCFKVCQQNNPVQGIKPKTWYQGWSSDENIRRNSSSGGVGSALIKAFVAQGGKACSCVFKNGKFVFEIIDSVDDIIKFSGSKYIKSNPIGIYKQVKDLLIKEKDVLFLGLPCQVAGLKSFVGSNLEKHLITIDLICHGTPSPKVLDMYLKSNGHENVHWKNILFRNKLNFQIYKVDSNYNCSSIDIDGITDAYLLSFLRGICYTENCYKCKYANLNRISDITIGDSWGSNLSSAEQQKGISLVLIQTDKGNELVKEVDLTLFDVDIDNAIKHNQQLKSPAKKTLRQEKFFEKLDENWDFNKTVDVCLPWSSFKQQIKRIVFKIIKN